MRATTIFLVRAGVVGFSAAATADPICHVRGKAGQVQVGVNTSALDAHHAHGDREPSPCSPTRTATGVAIPIR